MILIIVLVWCYVFLDCSIALALSCHLFFVYLSNLYYTSLGQDNSFCTNIDIRVNRSFARA